MKVSLSDAKEDLSRLVKKALAGEEVIIAIKGVPKVKLVPVGRLTSTRKAGAWAHLVQPDNEAFSPVADRKVAADLVRNVLSSSC